MPGIRVSYGVPVNDTDVDLYWIELRPPTYVDGQAYPFAMLYAPGVWRALSIGPHMLQCQKDMANNGYIACIVAYRTLVEQLPNQDGSASAQWPNQTNDCKMSVKYARTLPRCNGKIVAIGGSSGGTHALSVSCEHETTSAWNPSLRADCCVSMSGCYDLGSRIEVDYETLDQFVSANEAYTGDMDPAAQTVKSLVNLVDATCKPTYFAHSNHDPMPFPQQAIMTDLLTSFGLSNWVAVVNGTDSSPSDAHAFDNWVLTENSNGTGPIMQWIAARLAGDAPLPPVISSFTPESFHIQDTVTITGSNFSGASSVTFGDTEAQSFILLSASTITAVPAVGTVTGGVITVTTPIGSGSSADTYTIEEVIPEPGAPTTRTPILAYPVGGLPPAPHAAPAPPTSLVATTPHTISSGTVHISWTPPNTNGLTLLPYRMVLTGGSANVPVIPGNVTSIDVDGLDDDTVYTVNLYSNTAFGESATAGTVVFTSDPGSIATVRAEPRGSYVVFTTGGTGIPSYDIANFWSNPNLSGGRYRGWWKNIQPDDVNTYDWADLDNFLAECVTFGKFAGVSIAFGIASPTWLTDDPLVVSINETGPDPGLMPYPWNDRYLQYINGFYTAFAARYDNHPQLAYVVLSGMGQIVETVLCKTPDYAAMTAQAALDGFDTVEDAWLFAAQRNISMAAGVFRQTRLVVSLAQPTSNHPASDTVLDFLVVYGLNTVPTQFGIMNAGLNASSNVGFEINALINNYSDNIVAGFQYAVASTNPACDRTQTGTYDPELAFQHTNTAGALDLKAKYIEMYPHDATNSDVLYVADIVAANALMAANPDGDGMP